jgi:arylsulfatase
MAVTTPLSFGLGGGVVVGADVGSPITSDYRAPFPFTGKLYTVTVDVGGELIKDDEMTMKRIMARQ